MQVQDKNSLLKPFQHNAEADATAALRAQLERELKSKKQCSYQPYECTQFTLDGYKYCLKHILHDKNSPFKQCSYVYTSNGKRCHLAAPRGDKKDFGYCNEHALKSMLAKNRQNAKYPPPKTAEVLLHSLSHYIKKPRSHSSSNHHSDDSSSNFLEDSSELKETKSLDPFVDLDAESIHNEKCNEVLELCSESESDVEAATFSTVWHDAQSDSSDNESIDSEHEDIFKRANVYTAEEITMVTKEKLIRLQSLYIEQYRHLQHLLREKRRKYLYALKREKETCCNIYSQVRDNPKEQRLYKKLKAFNNYHRSHGVEAILSKRIRDLRAKLTDGTAAKPHTYPKCLFTEGGVKCGEKTLPLARHCRKHILEDSFQVLFKACGVTNDEVECNTPVEAIFDDATCCLHSEVPPLRSYNQTRKDSESDFEESADVNLPLPLPFISQVKSELMDYNLPTEIPKMETLPSMLFEETDDNLLDDSHMENDIYENNIDPIEDSKNDIKIDEEEEKKPTGSDLIISENKPDLSMSVDVKDELITNKQEIKTEEDVKIEDA